MAPVCGIMGARKLNLKETDSEERVGVSCCTNKTYATASNAHKHIREDCEDCLIAPKVKLIIKKLFVTL